LLNRNPSDQDREAPGKASKEARPGVQDEARDGRSLRLLHAVRSPRGLTPEQVRRIASRLDAAAVPVPRRSLVPVLAASALLLSAGTAAAWATGTLPRIPVLGSLFSSTRLSRPAPPHAMVASPGRSLAVAAPKEEALTAELDQLGEPDRTEASQAPRREDRAAGVSPASRRHVRVPPGPLAARPEPAAPQESHAARPEPTGPGEFSTAPSKIVPPSDSPIAREGESFGTVLRSWRRNHDHRAALSALDLHDHAFAGGQMTLESRLLRIEILLSDGRDREGLALLDRLALGSGTVPRSRELLTVRGELRIRAGRCADGRADLAPIGAGSDGFAKRARNALTHCP